MKPNLVYLQRPSRPGNGSNTLSLVPPSPASRLDETSVVKVLQLIASVNLPPGRTTLRTHFNSDLLALALEPAVRASLGSTLQRLVAAGLLVRCADNEYSLTPAGVRSMQRAPARRLDV